MNIYIPTYGRVGKQITLAALPPSLRKRTWLVVRPEEATVHDHYNVLVCDRMGVPAARQHACEHARSLGKRFAFMFDDDLRFAIRPSSWNFAFNEVKLKRATVDDIADHIENTELYLKKYPMVGWDGRGGNNRIENRYHRPASRIMRAFGVDVKLIHKLGIRFDRFPFWEDFHVNLSLLERGYLTTNVVEIVNDGVTNAAGGVSTYRNIEKMTACLKDFCRVHPCAKPVMKKTKWKGLDDVEVPDMVVYWKKAAMAGGAL